MQDETPLTMETYKDVHLKSILDYFYEWEQKKPDAVFLRQPYGDTWKTTTWREAGLEARKMAAALEGIGLKPGDHIGIVSKNCYHWILADLAIMMGGFVSVPFYPTLNAAQLQQVLELSHAKALFVGKLDDWPSMRGGVSEQVQIIAFPHYEGNSRVDEGLSWEGMVQAYDPIPGSPRRDLDDLFSILYTSGTTGVPKGVMLDFFAPAALMENERRYDRLKLFSGNEHRFFSYLPLCHIAERLIVEGAALLTGGEISFAESLESFAKNLQQTRPTLFMGVPRIWNKFQQAILSRMPQHRLGLLLKLPFVSGLIKRKIRGGLGLDEARILLTGAAPMPDAVKDWYAMLGIHLQEVYGMTESCGGATLMPRDAIKPGVVGKPLPNVELGIVPETGEVTIRLPWVMRGYYNEPEKTLETLRDGVLYTGDQGELDENGYLKITGRISDTFKSAKGKFIVPGPIEWSFAKNQYIEQVCVAGLGIPQPLALVVLSELGKQEPVEKLRESLQETLTQINGQLPNYEQLKAIVVVETPWSVENGLLTPTMKIKRHELNKRYQHLFHEWYARGEQLLWVTA